jgi:hypothetical protein
MQSATNNKRMQQTFRDENNVVLALPLRVVLKFRLVHPDSP